MAATPGNRRLTLVLAILLPSMPAAARAASPWMPDRTDVGFGMFHRYLAEENMPLAFPFRGETRDDAFYLGHLVASLDADWHGVGEVYIVLDSGELSERTILDDTIENDRSDDAFFQQGYFESYFLDDKGVAFKIGQQHLVFGEGFILDDFLLSGQVGFNLNRWWGIPWNLYASVTRVRGASVYTQLRAVHPVSSFEKLSLSLGWLHDAEGFVAEILETVGYRKPGLFPEGVTFDSGANLFWLALFGNRHLSFCTIEAVAILEFGWLRVLAEREERRVFEADVPSLGFLVDLSLSRNLTERWMLEVFFLMGSGDENPASAVRQERTLGTFLSIVPFIRRTNIFFNGGINESLSTRSFASAGHEGRGFIVPGLTLTWFATDWLLLELKSAYLRAYARQPAGFRGRDYGWETDLTGYREVGKHVRLSVEADVLLPGSFFASEQEPDPDPAYRFVGGIDVCF